MKLSVTISSLMIASAAAWSSPMTMKAGKFFPPKDVDETSLADT